MVIRLAMSAVRWAEKHLCNSYISSKDESFTNIQDKLVKIPYDSKIYLKDILYKVYTRMNSSYSNYNNNKRTFEEDNSDVESIIFVKEVKKQKTGDLSSLNYTDLQV